VQYNFQARKRTVQLKRLESCLSLNSPLLRSPSCNGHTRLSWNWPAVRNRLCACSSVK